MKSCDIKECVPNVKGSQHPQKNNYTFPVGGKTTFKRGGKVVEIFTPLNTHREKIRREVFHLHDMHTPPSPKAYAIGPKPGRWCKFHKVKGYHNEDFYKLKKEIECIIQEGHLKKYIKVEFSQRPNRVNSRGSDSLGSLVPVKGKRLCKEDDDKIVRHALNIIL